MKKRFLIAAILTVLAVQTCVIPTAVTVSAEHTVQAVQVSAKTTAVLSADKIPLGASVTVTAAPKAAAGCTYAFYYRVQGRDSWTTAKQYSQEASAVIKPSKAGKCEICVKTKNSSGKVTKEYLSISVVDDLAVNASLSATKAAVGTGVRVSAKANGGSGGYQYEVYWKKKTSSSWKTSLKNSTSCSVLINPAQAGEYDVCVKVKDKNGILKKEYFTFEVVDFKVNVSFLHDAITLGQKETISADVSGISEDYTFSFYYRKTDAASWKLIQGYKTNHTVMVLPKEAGTYEVCAKAKNPSGIIRKTYSKFTVTKKSDEEKLTVKGTFSDGQSTVYLDTPATFTANASGGAGGYTYSLKYREKGTTEWKLLRNFSTDPKFKLERSALGSYTLKTSNNFELTVSVKDADGKIVSAVYPFTVTSSDRYELPII